MNGFEDLEKKLEDIKQQTSPETDERILEDAFSEFQRSSKVRQTVFYIGPVFKTVVAAIFIAIITGAILLFLSREWDKPLPIVKEVEEKQELKIVPPKPEQAEITKQKDSEEKLKADLEQVMVLITAKDSNGLLAILEDTEEPAQMLAANHLGQFGDEQVAEILVEMGQKNFPNDPDNFFEKAAENIFTQHEEVIEEANGINETEVETVLDEPCEVIIEPNQIFYTMSGYVYNEMNEPLSFAHINIANLKTDSDIEGWYELKDIPNDVNFEIIFFKDGYGYHPLPYGPIDSNATLDIQIFPQAYDWYNKPAPELIVQEWLNCEPFKLSDLTGKYVLLYLGLSSQGGPSPYHRLVELNREHYDINGIAFVAVHEYIDDEKEKDELFEMLESEQIDIPVAIDDHMDSTKGIALEDERYYDGVKFIYKHRGIRSGGATHSIYEVRQRPSYYLIDPNGILLKCLGEDLKRD